MVETVLLYTLKTRLGAVAQRRSSLLLGVGSDRGTWSGLAKPERERGLTGCRKG